MRVFTNKQELLEWHQKEALGWNNYASNMASIDETEKADKAHGYALMHESAVHVLETLE